MNLYVIINVFFMYSLCIIYVFYTYNLYIWAHIPEIVQSKILLYVYSINISFKMDYMNSLMYARNFHAVRNLQ
jgi:hypothetical protein